MFPPEKYFNILIFFRLVAALFRFVARFARIRIENSCGYRFASTAYFAKPGYVGGECSGGKEPGLEPSGGNFPGRNIPVTVTPAQGLKI